LLAQDFTQSIVELRLRYKHLTGGELPVVSVHVDEKWTVRTDDAEWDRSLAAWRAAFVDSSGVLEAGNEFCDVLYDDVPDGCLELSCGMLSIGRMMRSVSNFKVHASVDMPMLSDSLQCMRELGGPLLRDSFADTYPIMGLRLFAGIGVSLHIAHHLTQCVWDRVLRWAYFYVGTKLLRLVFRPPRLVDEFPCVQANSHSSCINCAAGDGGAVGGVPDAVASMGGYSVYFEESRAAIAECFSPKLAESSAGSEVVMAPSAGKAVLAVRKQQHESRLGPKGATPRELCAAAVLIGAMTETMMWMQCFNAARLGMLWQLEHDKALRLEKVATGDMRLGILAKLVPPVEQFQRLAQLLLTGSF